jgi:hypothetical protein
MFINFCVIIKKLNHCLSLNFYTVLLKSELKINLQPKGKLKIKE